MNSKKIRNSPVKRNQATRDHGSRRVAGDVLRFVSIEGQWRREGVLCWSWVLDVPSQATQTCTVSILDIWCLSTEAILPFSDWCGAEPSRTYSSIGPSFHPKIFSIITYHNNPQQTIERILKIRGIPSTNQRYAEIDEVNHSKAQINPLTWSWFVPKPPVVSGSAAFVLVGAVALEIYKKIYYTFPSTNNTKQHYVKGILNKHLQSLWRCYVTMLVGERIIQIQQVQQVQVLRHAPQAARVCQLLLSMGCVHLGWWMPEKNMDFHRFSSWK